LTSVNADYLCRMLRALAGEGIFKELPGRCFENSRLSKAFMNHSESVKYFDSPTYVLDVHKSLLEFTF